MVKIIIQAFGKYFPRIHFFSSLRFQINTELQHLRQITDALIIPFKSLTNLNFTYLFFLFHHYNFAVLQLNKSSISFNTKRRDIIFRPQFKS